LTAAVKDADLISESVPENVEIKKDFYQKLSKVAPKKNNFYHQLFLHFAKRLCSRNRPAGKVFGPCQLLHHRLLPDGCQELHRVLTGLQEIVPRPLPQVPWVR
jgi:hypothetical protein